MCCTLPRFLPLVCSFLLKMAVGERDLLCPFFFSCYLSFFLFIFWYIISFLCEQKKQQDDDRHRAEVERILTLAIDESDRLKKDRDRLRALNDTLLRKLASAGHSVPQDTSTAVADAKDEDADDDDEENFEHDTKAGVSWHA